MGACGYALHPLLSPLTVYGGQKALRRVLARGAKKSSSVTFVLRSYWTANSL